RLSLDTRSGTSLQATKTTLVKATPAGSTQTKGRADRILVCLLRSYSSGIGVLEAKRLRRYFQAHPIVVITDQPIKQIISRPDAAGRLQKWSVMLGEHNVAYRPRTSVKGHILADFLVEKPDEAPPDTPVVETPQEPWTLFMNGSSCVDSTNSWSPDSSTNGGAQSTLLKEKSIQEKEVAIVFEEEGPTWMTPIVEYLRDGTLPDDKKEASKLRIKARQYELVEGVLYMRSFLTPWLRCVGPLQADYVIREIHEGSGRVLANCRSNIEMGRERL
ncbi:hypothetical protein Tco_0382431, partial [Tanacetum coccineum]